MDDDINLLRESRFNDSDSQEGGGSDSSSNSSTDGNTPSTAQHSSNNSDNDKQIYKSLPSTSTLWVPNSQRDDTSSRRLSKDESTSSSNSESPQSGDEYHVYFYSSKDISLINSAQNSLSTKMDDTEDKTSMFSSLRRCDDPWDVLFSRAEGLHAHGHSREACRLGVKLAEELLMNPPDLMIEIPPIPKKKGKWTLV